MSIELNIERLVIDAAVLGGEPAGDVRAAIEQELARVLTRPGAADSLRGLGAVAALSPAALPPVGKPHDHLGPRIATAVQSGLGIPAGTERKGTARHD